MPAWAGEPRQENDVDRLRQRKEQLQQCEIDPDTAANTAADAAADAAGDRVHGDDISLTKHNAAVNRRRCMSLINVKLEVARREEKK